MKKTCSLTEVPEEYFFPDEEGAKIGACKSGIYQGFDQDELIAIANEEDLVIKFLFPVGTFVLEGNPLFLLNKTPPNGILDKINVIVNIERGQEIDISYNYGFTQLMEIAVKALSPGINDPGTAVLALQALTVLVMYKFDHFAETKFKDKNGTVRLITKEKTFGEAFNENFYPIWDYGKNDRVIQMEMLHALKQLKMKGKEAKVEELYNRVKATVGCQD